MKRLTVLFITITLLTGCSSLKLRNLGKSVASSGIAYVVNPIAGVAVLATSMAYDEIIPDSPEVADIETKEQAVAYVADSLIINSLYAFIAFLLITNILVPWFTKRRGYNQAKGKYKNND